MDELLHMLGRHQRRSLDEPPGPSARLAAAERESLLDEVMAQLDDANAKPDNSASEGVVVDLRAPGPSVPRDRARPSERRSSLPVVLGAIAAVAAVVLLWRFVAQPDRGPQLARLPDYIVTQQAGGVASSRSAPTAAPRPTLHPESAIDWVFTPKHRVSGPVAVALLATSSQGATVFSPEVEAQVSAQGVVRLSGPLHEIIALEPGLWTLAVLLASPDDLPTDEAAVRAQDAGPWRTVEISLTVVPTP